MNKPVLRVAIGFIQYGLLFGILLALLLTLGLSSCIPAATPVYQDNNSIEIYFSGEGHDSQGVIDALVNAINDAQSSVDVAMYNINLKEIEMALLQAEQRGVRVRIVMESDALDGRVPRNLVEKGIPIVSDGKESLMHNKFMVIDQTQVWTGSLNLTESGMTEDRNNLVRLNNTDLAQLYTDEFEEMYIAKKFGNDSPASELKKTQYDVDSIPVSVYFSPDDRVMEFILNEVNQAQQTITVLGYSFTSDPLAEALIERAHYGVQVSGVFDRDMYKANIGTEYDRLVSAGLFFCLDGESGLMHNKVIVIDEKMVILGSYNFTASAERYNDENVVFLYDRDIAQEYLQEAELIMRYCK